VDDANVRAVCELKLASGQDTYVAPAAYTVAEAAYEDDGWLRAIYLGDQPVGLVYAEGDKLVRLMVDAHHQRRGVGRAAIPLVADELRRARGLNRLYTSYVDGPADPREFYLSLGFEDTGRRDGDGERVLALTLGSEP
jgi:diamine N-acetyltransferase